jgi:hypothetical protein
LFKLFLLTSIFLPIWCEFTIHGGGEWQWVPFFKKKYLDALPTLEVACLDLIVISRSLGCGFGALIILETILYSYVKSIMCIKRAILLFLKFI